MERKVMAPVHPGEILMKEFLEPMGITQYRLAKDINVPARRINEIVHAKRAVTANTALRLSVLYAVDYYSTIAKQKNIEMLIDENEREIEVWADRIGVAVVLDNLLSNAIKYTNPGGKVRVQVSREQHSCLCSICDNGPGLVEADLAQLFQPGVRLSATPTAGESSSGYGLAVAKKLIDNMHGEIWCDTEYGKGACFRFRLPISP